MLHSGTKALAILTRSSLPTRTELTADVAKHVAKGARQLGGALRAIAARKEKTTRDGQRLAPSTSPPSHCIVLVPDLRLMAGSAQFGGDFLRQWSAEHGAFLHILDPAQLFRIAHAGAMLTVRSSRFSARDGFDAHLMTRFEAALGQSTPDFDLILRIEGEIPADA